MNAGQASAYRYLRLAGAINLWFAFPFLVIASWIVAQRFGGDKSQLPHYLFLMLVPFAAGTGLVSAGRRGELDLLLGAGVSRRRLWTVAFACAWAIPALMAFSITWLSAPGDTGATLLRVTAVLTLVGGVSFATGLVEVRYFAAVAWLLSRLLVLLWPDTMMIVKQWETGADVSVSWLTVLVAAALPELMVDRHTPAGYLIAAACCGVAAIAVSYRWFCSAEFGGKRA